MSTFQRPVNVLALALRTLRRDWRAGELQVLIAALIIAVAGISSVGFFTDRIQRTLEQQANALLGADLVISATTPLPDTLRQRAAASGLQQEESVDFRSMVLAAEKLSLAAIKAVGEHYPLRGEVRIAPALFQTDHVARDSPKPGTVWAEAALLTRLGIRVGDSVNVGNIALTVSAVLVHEPVRAGNFFAIAPKALINIADVERSGLIQPGSRARWRLLLAGSSAQLDTFRTGLDALLSDSERIEEVKESQPEIRTALKRARHFLGLAALISVMLAAVAVITATRRFIQRHLDSCAIMRCLGANQSIISRLYGYQLLCIGVVASAIGCLLGFAAQEVLVKLLGGFTTAQLPPPSWQPVLFGMLTGIVTLLGGAAPSLLQLKNVTALRVLRRDLGQPPPLTIIAYVICALLLSVLFIAQAGDGKLGLFMALGSIAALLLMAALAALMVFVTRRLLPYLRGTRRTVATAITRHSAASVVQISAFGIGIMALLLLTLLRGDLLDEWQARIPDDAPNRFIINIQADQLDGISAYFADNGLTSNASPAPEFFPMIRGRLSAINGRTVTNSGRVESRAQRLTAREFNLSWAAQPRSGNSVTKGQWWTIEEHGGNQLSTDQLSIDEDVAKTLGIGIGDNLRFTIADRTFSATVTNLRSIDWDSFQANFYILAPPGALNDYPLTYLATFHLPAAQQQQLGGLLRAFPNLTMIDVGALLQQVRTIVERVTLAVEYVFLFSILAGLTVLYAAIQSTLDERIYENAVMRTLGASRRRLLAGLIGEFTTIGLFSGLLAAFAASAVAYLLSAQIFNLGYITNPWIFVIGALGGALGIGLAGTLGTRFILNQPPLKSLNRG